MKRKAGVHLAGAVSRLLPASIPFRYFAAAIAYHLLAWLALLAGVVNGSTFAGTLGWPLAALHLITLGVLVMTALGASLQLLPVATRQPVRWRHGPALIWWLYTPGVAAVALGMGMPSPALLAGGAVVVAAALVVFAGLLARNLIGARGMPAVVAHCWSALAALVVVLATALSLACAYIGMPGLARGTSLALHVAFAGYGFMGMLALGLSYILVPMFALSAAPAEREALASCALALVALALAAVAAVGIAPQALRIAAIGIGAATVGLHLRLMAGALRTGMRRELGLSFRLVRISWALLVVSLVAGLAVTLDAPVANMGVVFGLTLVVGWLLTFLLGILQRIVPFLAAMHAPRGTRPPPTPSALTALRPLAVHFHCHLAALLLLAMAVILESRWLTGAAASIGAIGAAAFAGFFVIVLQRMIRIDPAAKVRAAPAA